MLTNVDGVLEPLVDQIAHELKAIEPETHRRHLQAPLERPSLGLSDPRISTTAALGQTTAEQDLTTR